MLVAAPKLDTIEILISKYLIDSYISHDKFVSLIPITQFSKFGTPLILMIFQMNTLQFIRPSGICFFKGYYRKSVIKYIKSST